MNPWLFALSALVYLFIIYLSARRLSLLLDKQYPLSRVFSLCLIGSFFNTLLPGAIGGDAVKAYYLYKDTKKGGSSIGAVFMDRYIGFVALLTMGLVSGFFALSDLKTIGMQWVIPALFIFFFVGSLFIFRLQIGKRYSAISDFYDYFHQSLTRKDMLLKTYGISFIIQLFTSLMIYLIAMGIGQSLTFTALFVFVPIITIITMIPLSISGLGVRESAFVLFFGFTGVPPQDSTSISFLWFLAIAAPSLIGLVEYLRMRRH
jgi:uncharacterized membrane protein YbhN (UPF0104 family)